MSESQSPKVYTVSELTEEIKDLLEDNFEFVWLEGEISNFRSPASGHYYMVIKDENAQIKAVMFRLQARLIKFLPENGMKVIAQGRVGVYSPRGEYQIILDYLEPMGVGNLALAFEQLKKRLSAQGIFDEKIKKPLPYLPQRVAVITSPTGAAIRDFLKIMNRRFANMEIMIVPVKVQGEGASTDIVLAIEFVNRELDADVIILTRGGGSLEDLWAFNEEELALAIRRSEIPVMSAVGHEIDLTICDLAADFRAPTPSAAAELLVVEKESLVKNLLETRNRLIGIAKMLTNNLELDLNRLKKGIKDPKKRLYDLLIRLDEIQARINRSVGLALRENRKILEAEERALHYNSPRRKIIPIVEKLDFFEQILMRRTTAELRNKSLALSNMNERLNDLSPLSILKRGYSITRRLPEKSVLKSSSVVDSGEKVHIQLAEGELECNVEKVVG